VGFAVILGICAIALRFDDLVVTITAYNLERSILGNINLIRSLIIRLYHLPEHHEARRLQAGGWSIRCGDIELLSLA
jgi:hypothetical protein